MLNKAASLATPCAAVSAAVDASPPSITSRGSPGAPRGGRFRRWAKEAMFAAYLYGGPRLVRRFALRGVPQIVIVYYHRIGGLDYVSRPAESFRCDLAYLSRHFECLTLHELCGRLDREQSFRRPMAAVTFDDGYLDNFTVAMPLLQAAGVPATFFVSTGYMSTSRVFPHDQRAQERGMTARTDWPKLTWDHLRAMQAAGMEIGSHTIEHTNMGRVDTATARREAEQSLADLNRELGLRPRAFCFPWGKPADATPEAAEIVQRAGYYAAVTTTCGEVSHCSSRYGLPRIDVGNGAFSSLSVAARIQGCGCGRLAHLLH